MKTLSTRSIVLATALSLVAAGAWAVPCPGPDTFGHRCIDNPAGAAYAPATNTVGVNCDDCSVSRAIGFTYKHFGVNMTTCTVTSNGFIELPGNYDSFAGYCAYPVGALPGYLGAYNDLYPPAGGSVLDATSGTAPNRIYAVQWICPYYPGTGAKSQQIQLFENNGSGEMARILINTATGGVGDIGFQSQSMTDGLGRGCNTVAAPFNIEFSKVAAPPPTGCNLAPIEAKLDDRTRFTDDTERNAQVTTITNNVLNGINPNLTRLETKLDDGTRFTSDAERTTQTNTLVTEINANETKIDRLEAKLDDEIRFTSDAELAVVQQSIDALEVKADNQGTDIQTLLERNIEHAMGEDHNVNRPLALFMLPNAFGGVLEQVRDLVDRRINDTVAAGCSDNGARALWNSGNTQFGLTKWDAAYSYYTSAYRNLSMGPCN